MSFESYSKWWIKTKTQVEKLQDFDKLTVQTTKPTKNRALAFNLVSGLYCRYSMIVQEIDTCLDQMCQPQKRFTVRKIMDAATTRLNELKEEMKKIELSEYHYVDGSLIELKLIPHDVEILHPALFYPRPLDVEEMWEKIKSGETIYTPPPPPPPLPSDLVPNEENAEGGLTGDLATISPTEGAKEEEAKKETPAPEESTKETAGHKKKRARPKKFVPEVPELSPEEIEERRKKEIITEAVKLVQTHERARQGRMYFLELYTILVSKKAALVPGKKAPPAPELEIVNPAAIEMQRKYRGHQAKEYVKRRERERRLLIGMTEPSWKSKVEYEKFQQNLEKRRALRDQRIKEYIKANLDEKQRVLRVIGPGLMEDIGDEIREWFVQWYKRARNFDKYPDEEKGGSILIVRGETMTPEEWIDEVERVRRLKAKLGKDYKKKMNEAKAKEKAKEKERKRKEKEQQKKEAAKQKKKRPEDFEFEFEKSPADDGFKTGFIEYKQIWDEINDFDNPLEEHYMEMITEEKCYEMQLELRPKVDELMRLELEMLEDALERDKLRMKGKKGKAKKKKKKNKKKKKGKKNKDQTANRSTEDLFQELVDNGIIRTYPPTRLEEYKGDFSYGNWEKRILEFDPPPTLGDVRQAVLLNCILPIGVERMVKPKSVLIAGPRQSGKHLLANAVFTETKSVLFDLSPHVLAGKYPGKKGMKMLLHLVNKMSRLLQPSVIFIDGAEKPFYKKVPKEEKELEPKRLGTKLFKGIVKPILPEDRVLVLSITGKPWTAKAKGLKKTYERIILIPPADYGSIFLYWRELLMPYHGIDRNFDCSAITKLTVAYPLIEIKKAVEKVLTPRRIIQLSYKPLHHSELYEAILDCGEPVGDKEFKKFEKWFKKTPLAKQRGRIIAIADLKRQQEAKQAEKAQQKK